MIYITNEVQVCIFATNSFAKEYPDVHVELWEEFEKLIPPADRTGYYGADNVAYIKFLRKSNNPVFDNFYKNVLEIQVRNSQ